MVNKMIEEIYVNEEIKESPQRNPQESMVYLEGRTVNLCSVDKKENSYTVCYAITVIDVTVSVYITHQTYHLVHQRHASLIIVHHQCQLSSRNNIRKQQDMYGFTSNMLETGMLKLQLWKYVKCRFLVSFMRSYFHNFYSL